MDERGFFLIRCSLFVRASKNYAWKAALVLGLLFCPSLVGCWNSSAKTTNPSVPSVGGPTEVVLPTVTQTPDQIRNEMKQYEPFSPQFEESRLKLTIALEAIRKREGVEGFQTFDSPRVLATSPAFYVDPQTHDLYWRAGACWNPNCPGRGRGGGPFLFARELPHVTVAPDGNVVLAEPDLTEMMKPTICPACKSDKFIHSYDLPEAVILERELMSELKKSYAAVAKAAKEGRPMPTKLRSIQEITTDLENVPKLFLLAEPGKVKKFEAFTAPVGAGLGGAK